MDTTSMGEVPLLLPSSPHTQTLVDDNTSDRTDSNTASARNSTQGSDGIFDRHLLRSPINGSESEYEDEDDLISEMPVDSHAPSCCGDETQEDEARDFAQYTPSRRSPFRNPSSVRGMQLETTPPHMRSPTHDSINKHRNRLSIGSRNSTPRSVRSYRSGSPTKIKPVPKKENLLVLLHVTILPITCPYSQALLQEIAPPHILQNWKLLREKVPDTVLERGILIPHPREEYELLEERLLESLELAIPGILKCGHYHREETDGEESDAEGRRISIPSSLSQADDSEADSDVCVDCTRHIRDGSRGSTGTGKRRWNMRIYAANGLMRAGAWSAAWKEMERVDVEISPWMDDVLRRDLELRRVQEQEEDALQISERLANHHISADTQLDLLGMDEERRREIYGDTRPHVSHFTERNFTPGDIVAAYEHGPRHHDEEEEDEQDFLDPAHLPTPTQDSLSPIARHAPAIRVPKRYSPPAAVPPHQHQGDASTTRLLMNYIKLLLRDQRNAALLLLSVVVLWLALRPALPPAQTQTQTQTQAQALSSPLDRAENAMAALTDAIQDKFTSVMPESLSATLSSVTNGLPGTLVDTTSDILPTPSMDSIQSEPDPSIEV